MIRILQRRGADFAIAIFRNGMGNRMMHSIGIDFGDERDFVVVHIFTPDGDVYLRAHRERELADISGIILLAMPMLIVDALLAIHSRAPLLYCRVMSNH